MSLPGLEEIYKIFQVILHVKILTTMDQQVICKDNLNFISWIR